MPPPSARWLAVLGAGRDQLYLIRTARRMGLCVLAFDRDPRAPGFAEADAHAAVSTRDVPALLGFLARWPHRGALAGVITMGSDIPREVQAVAARLGLARLSEETARLATDKLAMKERFRTAGVPIPWFDEVLSARELRRALARRGPRLVLKPIDRSGSRGVFLVDETSSLEELFARSRAVALSGRVMVEEFLAGPQISTETVMVDGRGLTPGFADRNYEHLERFRPRIVENGGWVPSRLAPGDRRRVCETAVLAARALGIEDGIAKGDLVLAPDGPRVIEIAARLSGGDFCESLVPLGSGVNVAAAAIRLALGERPDAAFLAPRFQRAVANRYLFAPPGILERVEGEDEVRALPWVEKLELARQPGERVPALESHADRLGVFVVSAPERETLEERIAEVYRTLRPVVRRERTGAA